MILCVATSRMTLFLTRPWIEKAVLCEDGETLPRKVKAQITEVEEENEYGEHFAVITDNQLFITALFSEESVSTALSEEIYESLTEINGGFIVITKYKVIPKLEEVNYKEFIVVIEHFKLYGGGEGTLPLTEFNKEITDSKSYPPIADKLLHLWETEQLYDLYNRYSLSFAMQTKNGADTEDLLKKIHKVHAAACLFTQRQSQPDTVKEINLGVKTPNFCHSQETNSSSDSEPVSPAKLLDYVGNEPLVMEFDDNTQSQSLCFYENYVNPASELTTRQSDLSLLIGVTDALLNETGEQSQQKKKLIPRPELPQLYSGANCSCKKNCSEDIRNFIDEYWIMKHRQLNA